MKREPGPSPRAWGLPEVAEVQRAGRRAIPTCVGTTPRAPEGGGLGTGHPHVRGDYVGREGPVLVGRRAIPTCVGTTPCAAQDGPRLRAIPTCVGTT